MIEESRTEIGEFLAEHGDALEEEPFGIVAPPRWERPVSADQLEKVAEALEYKGLVKSEAVQMFRDGPTSSGSGAYKKYRFTPVGEDVVRRLQRK